MVTSFLPTMMMSGLVEVTKMSDCHLLSSHEGLQKFFFLSRGGPSNPWPEIAIHNCVSRYISLVGGLLDS